MLVETVALGAGLLGKIFIMFGDHYLMNPSIKSLEAEKLGMSISLFWWMVDRWPDHVVRLT